MFKQAAFTLLAIAYPLLVFSGMQVLQPLLLAGLLAAFALLRGLTTRDPAWRACAVFAGLLSIVVALSRDVSYLKLYPVTVNGIMLAIFGASLWQRQTIIERISRLTEPDLNAHGVRYTRRLTQVWCVFFICNGAVALWTALAASDAVWALYNGAISYALMGTLMGIEYLVRRRFKARHAN